MNNEYVLVCSFKGNPDCGYCVLGRFTSRNLDGNSVRMCQALGVAGKCPDEGCRKDCPLVRAEDFIGEE